MKILITSGIFIPEIGGPATYAAKLAKELLKLNHQVTILTYSATANDDFDNKLAYQVVRVKRTYKIKNYYNYYTSFKQLMRQNNYDVIYCFDHFSAGLPVTWANRKFKKKLLIRVGGDFIWERYIERTNNLVTLRQFYQRRLHLKQEKLRFKLIQWVFKQAHRIIFTTEFQRDIFIAAYKINLDKTAIIHNPVDQLDKANLHQKNKSILFAGRFIQKNNINFLIDAFLAMRDKTFILELIGTGPLKKVIEQRIKSLKNKQIKLVNKLTGSEFIKKIAQSYLVIFPSLTDISPNTLLECLQNGIPFISTTEIGYNWFDNKVKMFDPQNLDELVTVLNNLTKQKEYEKYKHELSMLNYRYTYQQAAQETINIIQQI